MSLLRRIRRPRSGSTALVLMYHRVAAPPCDPYLLSVMPERFAQHLDVLTSGWSVVALRDALRLARRGGLPPRAVVVTFDDGYADNLLAAKPLLERYDVPATVFVASGYVEAGWEFWWDELERIFLQPGTLPPTLRLDIDGVQQEWSLDGAREYTAQDYDRLRGWTVLDPTDPSRRQAVCRSLQGTLRVQQPRVRDELLEAIRCWAGAAAHARPSHRALTRDEVTQLAAGGLVEVGGHTVRHPMLTTCPAEEQEREIVDGKRALEEILGARLRSFAYPFGGPADYDGTTVSLVGAAGFECACSNFEGMVSAETDPMQLPRTMMMDWPADEFEARLEELSRGG